VLAIAFRSYVTALERSRAQDQCSKVTELWLRWQASQKYLGPAIELIPQFLIISILTFVIGLVDSLFYASAQLDHPDSQLIWRISVVCTVIFSIVVGIILWGALWSVVRPWNSPFASVAVTGLLWSVYHLIQKLMFGHSLDKTTECFSVSNIKAYHDILSKTDDDEMLDDGSSALKGILESAAAAAFHDDVVNREKTNNLLVHLLSSRAGHKSARAAGEAVELIASARAQTATSNIFIQADVILAVMSMQLSSVPGELWGSHLTRALANSLGISLWVNRVGLSQSRVWYFRILWSKWDVPNLRDSLGTFMPIFSEALLDPQDSPLQNQYPDILDIILEDICVAEIPGRGPHLYPPTLRFSRELEVVLTSWWESTSYLKRHDDRITSLFASVTTALILKDCQNPLLLLPLLSHLWKKSIGSTAYFSCPLIVILLRDLAVNGKLHHAASDPMILSEAEQALTDIALSSFQADAPLSPSRSRSLLVILSWVAVLPRDSARRSLRNILTRVSLSDSVNTSEIVHRGILDQLMPGGTLSFTDNIMFHIDEEVRDGQGAPADRERDTSDDGSWGIFTFP
jgi:hypothetical protein